MFGSSTSSCRRILEALGGSRSLQHQDPSALFVFGRLTNRDLPCLSVSGTPLEARWDLFGLSGRLTEIPCRLSDGFLTCSGAPQAPVGGSWRLLGALGACKIKIHRPCRCLGGSQVTICRACQCLEASQNAPKSRSIVPVGVWRPLRGLRHLSTGLRPGFDPASAHLIVGGLGPALKASLEA